METSRESLYLLLERYLCTKFELMSMNCVGEITELEFAINKYFESLLAEKDADHQTAMGVLYDKLNEKDDEKNRLTGYMGSLERKLNKAVVILEELVQYSAHELKCIYAQWREGRPTKDGGYETLYGYGKNEKWYQRHEKPECSCGLHECFKAIDALKGTE